MHALPCPHCGCIPPPPSSIPDDILSIQGAIQKIDDQIQHLNAHKARLLRQINSIESTTRHIPPETLSVVFQHLSNDVVDLHSLDPYARYMNSSGNAFDRNRSVIRLGAVSSLWRQVAWSTPQLWTTLIMTVQPHTAHSSAEIYQLSLTNAKNFAVTLDLHFPNPLSPVSWAPLALTLFTRDNANKIRTLILHNPPIEWLSPLSKDFNQLTSLTLKGALVSYSSSSSIISTPLSRKISLVRVPSLRSLTLRGIREHLTIAPSSTHTLTTLDLFSTPIHLCVQLLTNSPNLIECHCRSPLTLSFTSRDVNVPMMTSFPHLKILTWPLCEGRSNTTLLRRVRLPALETLRLCGTAGHGLGQSKEVVTHFFAYGLPGGDSGHTSLSTLELVNWPSVGWSRVDLVRLLSGLDGLQKLVLWDCFDGFSNEVVRVLTPRTVVPAYRRGGGGGGGRGGRVTGDGDHHHHDPGDANDDNSDDRDRNEDHETNNSGSTTAKFLPHLNTLSIRTRPSSSTTTRSNSSSSSINSSSNPVLPGLVRGMVEKRQDGIDSVFRLWIEIPRDDDGGGGEGSQGMMESEVGRLEEVVRLGCAEGRRLVLDLKWLDM